MENSTARYLASARPVSIIASHLNCDLEFTIPNLPGEEPNRFLGDNGLTAGNLFRQSQSNFPRR